MPFTTTPDLNPQPDVRIFLSGLLMLQPVGDDACQIFVNSSAPRHYLTIEVRRKREGRPDELMMRHIGPLAFVTRDQPGEVPLHGMIIRKIVGPNGQTGVRAFAPNEAQPDGAPDKFDLAIDMHSDLLHPQNREVARDPGPDPQHPIVHKLLDVDPLGGRPSILLEDGVLYSAAKVRDDVEVFLKKPDGTEEKMQRFAGLIGAAITLEKPTDQLVILWRQQGKLERLQLTKQADVTYEIYIVNDPLFENDAIASSDNPKHDEFAEYYKILHRVPTGEQFRLRVEEVTVNPQRGSSRLPCMPVVVSGGD